MQLLSKRSTYIDLYTQASNGVQTFDTLYAYRFWDATEKRYGSLGYFICSAVIAEVDQKCIDFLFYITVPGQSIGTWNIYTADGAWSTFLESQSNDMRDTAVTEVLNIGDVEALVKRYSTSKY